MSNKNRKAKVPRKKTNENVRSHRYSSIKISMLSTSMTNMKVYGPAPLHWSQKSSTYLPINTQNAKSGYGSPFRRYSLFGIEQKIAVAVNKKEWTWSNKQSVELRSHSDIDAPTPDDVVNVRSCPGTSHRAFVRPAPMYGNAQCTSFRSDASKKQTRNQKYFTN